MELATLSRRGGRNYNEDACGHWHSDSHLCCVVADGAGGTVFLPDEGDALDRLPGLATWAGSCYGAVEALTLLRTRIASHGNGPLPSPPHLKETP